MRGVRRFFSREKQVFLAAFSLPFPRFPHKSKNRLNTSLKFSMIKLVLKNFVIFTGKHLSQSLFLSCNFIKKETLAQGFSCEFCKIFKNTFFTEHLWMTASILQQLLALYFAIIYTWQLSSSENTLVGKKIHPYTSRILQILISFTQILFFIFFDKCLFIFTATQSACCIL